MSKLDPQSGPDASASARERQLAHDLRSPLNSIQVWSEVLLASDRLDPQSLDAVRAILRSAHAMGRRIEEFDPGAATANDPSPDRPAGPPAPDQRRS